MRVALLMGLLALTACDEPQGDLRFHTPQATVHTLFDVYGVADLSQQEVQRRMQERGRFHLQDPETYRLCFADWHGPEDEGAAGFVFGVLAVAKGELRITITGDRADVIPQTEGGAANHVVLKLTDGEWKIILRESVPAHVRRRLFDVYRSTKTLHEEQGTAVAN